MTEPNFIVFANRDTFADIPYILAERLPRRALTYRLVCSVVCSDSALLAGADAARFEALKQLSTARWAGLPCAARRASRCLAVAWAGRQS